MDSQPPVDSVISSFCLAFKIKWDGKSVTASVKEKDGSAEVVFPSHFILKAEQKLEITLSTGG